MTFWGDTRFKDKLNTVIPAGTPDRVHQGAYELSLGPEAYVSGEGDKKKLEPGSMVTIEPCATALLLTEEEVTIPNGTIGFISVRSRTKAKGLINISGFHVDPGFSDRLVFTVHNAGAEPIVLIAGEPYFLLWMADMDPLQPNELHTLRQNTIPADSVSQLRPKHISTVELKKDVDKLYGQRTFIIGALGAIVLALFTLVAEGFPWSRLGEKIGDMLFQPASQPVPSQQSGSTQPPAAEPQPSSSSQTAPTAKTTPIQPATSQP